MGFFSKIKQGLQKTRDSIANGVNSVINSFTKIDEELFEELAEHDPKAWLLLYHDMQKHVVPKQSQVNVSVGINKDFQELVALSTTKTDDPLAIGAESVPKIEDADYEELKEYEGL